MMRTPPAPSMASGHRPGYHRGMRKPAAVVIALIAGVASAQTPEQSELWERQHAQSLADQKARAEELAREREARRADPMAWVRGLDPMTSGGWQFRSVSTDGSWAAFVTDHQLKRSGQKVILW